MGHTVVNQLLEVADLKKDEFIILAGQEYIKPIASSITHLSNPLQGLKQGYRVKFLKDNTN